ncbi:MAG: VCBS repeat-containing protein [Acidobacteria bacterium]|nr:VCBS repeat-containing protein [Acidobacteriota bacterium]
MISVNVSGADGDLDTTFNFVGFRFVPIGNTAYVKQIAVQTDGKIVAAGDTYSGTDYDFALVRYNADGSLDSSFGTGGKLTTAFASGSNDFAFGVAIQNDGKILVAGWTNVAGGSIDFAVARYNSNGNLDTTFHTDGKVTTNIGTIQADDQARAIALQTDGKIVVAGFSHSGSDDDFAVVRYNSDGNLDTSFDTDGKVTTPIGTSTDEAHSVAVQTDGKIIVGGWLVGPNAMAVVRYNSNGSLDTAFDGDGKVTTSIGVNCEAYAVAVQPDGKILLGGFSRASTDNDFTLIRYNSDGGLDTSFDTDGKAITPIGSGSDMAHSIAIQPNGKILLAGSSNNGTNDDFALARYNANGSLDSAAIAATGANLFGTGGFVTTALAGIDYARSVKLQPDGKIVVGGTSNNQFVVARYKNAILKPIFDYDGDGKSDISIFRPSNGQWWLSRSTAGVIAHTFGNSSDRIIPADFTGDGKSDVAMFRPSNGEWFVLRSEDYSFYSFPFGLSTDVPVPADYDGDGRTDAAVFRPSNATWYIQRSSGGTTIQGFGAATDLPVPADYDGDGKADIAIYRPSLGQWWLMRSGAGVIAVTFGNSTDKPVPGDFTGDGKSDIAIWRASSGEWFILRSENYSFYSFPFGANGDIPSPADYDGDGLFDAAVFRGSSGTWYVSRSSQGLLIQQFGATGDRPTPAAFVP